MSSFLINLIKVIVLFDAIFLAIVTRNYIKSTILEKKMTEEDINTLTPIIESEVKKAYHRTRNTLVLKNVNDVYNYENVLIHNVQKELIDLMYSGQLLVSKFTDNYDIEMMIKHEVSKLGISVDKVIREERKIQDKPIKQQSTTVDISDSLMI